MKTASYTEWCNENEGRGYPISEDTTRTDDNGVVLPNDIIVDLCVLLPSGYTGARISSVYTSPTILSVAITTTKGGILTGVFSRTSIVPYKAYALTSLVPNVSGWVVFGNHRSQVVENYRFSSISQSALEQRTIKMIPPPGVTAFRRTGNNVVQAATGLVRLIGNDTVKIIRDPDPAKPQNILVGLAPDQRESFCEPCTRRASGKTCGAPVIRRVNNVPTDANGKITLRFE